MNIEHERNFIGCLFLMALRDMSPDDISIAASGIEPDDFADHQHQSIFAAVKLRSDTGQSFDVPLILKGCQGKVDHHYLFDLCANSTSTANTAEYKRLIKQYSIKRKGLALTNQIAELLHKNPDPVQTLGYAETLIKELMGKSSMNSSSFTHISKMLTGYIDDLEQKLNSPESNKGYMTGIKCFDDRLEDGIQAGSLIVMGGRPGMGKTALMLSLIRGFTESHKERSTFVYSLEMSLPQLAKRYATFYTGMSYDRMIQEINRDPDGLIWGKLAKMAHENRELPIYMKDTANLTVDQVCSDIRKNNRENPVGLVALDYLTLMKIPDSDRRDIGIGEVTRTLKNLAKEIGCVIVLLAQLNRSVESRPNKRPLPSDFRDSGSIEQDADYIITLYRDAVYDEDSPIADIAEADWCKVRHGTPFKAYMGFVNGAWVDTFNQPSAKERVRSAMAPKKKERPFASGI